MKSTRLVVSLALFLLGLIGITTVQAGDIEPGTPAKVNLVVYYDYDEQKPEKAKPFFEASSRRLFEATEGQLQLGRIEVFVNCPAKKAEADILIHEPLGGTATSIISGFGVKGAHMNFFQEHILTPTAAGGDDGSVSFVHELGHYLFSLYDEYQGETFSTKIPGNVAEVPIPPGVSDVTSVTANPLLFFCTGEGGLGTACLMNSGLGSNIQKMEFCTETNHTRHNHGVATAVSSGIFQEGSFGNLHRTDQEANYGRDCWRVLQQALESRGVTVNLPNGGAETTGGSPAAIEFEVKECAPAVSLVLDRSGSMSGSRLASLKRSATQVVGILEDGHHLGIVSYSSSPAVIFPLQPLDSSNRSQALAAIQSLSASGSTNIGGGILSGLGQLQSLTEEPEPGFIMLLTDGEHNTGTDPATAASQVANAGFTLNSVALGTNIDSAQLQSASEQTGGSLIVIEDDKDLAAAMVQQATSVQGDAVILSNRGTLQPGEDTTLTFPVDTFANRIAVASSWDSGSVSVELRDPSGHLINGSPQTTSNSIVLALEQPLDGTYSLKIQADSQNSGEAAYDVQVLGQSADLFFSARLQRTGPFPAPIKIEAFPLALGYPIADAKLTAVVRDPQGKELSIRLFDDGASGHGDTFRDDGSYSNLLYRLNGSGDYEVRIIIENADGKTCSGFENDPEFNSEPVPPFRREVRGSVNVDDFETLQAGGLELVEETEQIQDYSVPPEISDLYQLRFRLKTNSDQPVRINSFSFSSTGTGNEENVSVRLFIDSDQDGFIDVEGPTARPVADGNFDADDGSLELAEDLVLPPNSTTHFILTYRVDLTELLAVQMSLPLILVLFMPLFLHKTRRLTAACLAALVICFIIGCGSGNESFVFTSPNGVQSVAQPDPAPLNFEPQSFSTRLTAITAEGAVDGEPITVVNLESVQGPVVTIQRESEEQ